MSLDTDKSLYRIVACYASSNSSGCKVLTVRNPDSNNVPATWRPVTTMRSDNTITTVRSNNVSTTVNQGKTATTRRREETSERFVITLLNFAIL